MDNFKYYFDFVGKPTDLWLLVKSKGDIYHTYEHGEWYAYGDDIKDLLKQYHGLKEITPTEAATYILGKIRPNGK